MPGQVCTANLPTSHMSMVDGTIAGYTRHHRGSPGVTVGEVPPDPEDPEALGGQT